LLQNIIALFFAKRDSIIIEYNNFVLNKLQKYLRIFNNSFIILLLIL